MASFSQFTCGFNKVCPYDRYMVLNLFVENGDTFNSDLKNLYTNNANMHNSKLLSDVQFMDAGFDLMMPYNYDKNNVVGVTLCQSGMVNKLNLHVKCSAQMVLIGSNSCSKSCNASSSDIEDFTVVGSDSCFKKYNTGYYMYPRSSISKSCVRLANSTGIIDSGYRGNLIAMVDVVYAESFNIDAYDRLFQICAPGLVPVVVNVVGTVEELGVKTARGEGGFGSTGLGLNKG
jgi:hypothetical protein